MAKITLKLPDSFYKEEIRNGYTISTKMKKVWAVELDLFKQLDSICKKYNIPYYADSGTLLGAVRHHGFIPWDDDMDFIMYRKDFEKLCQVSAEFEYPYFFQTEETDPGSLRCHGQLRNSSTTGILKSEEKYKYPFNQGIFIDIFPIDNVPNDKNELQKFAKYLQTLKGRARTYYNYNHGIKNNIFNLGIKQLLKEPIKKIYYSELWHKYHEKNPYYSKYMHEVVKYNNEKTNYVMDLVLGTNFNPLSKKDIGKPKYLTFEGFKMPVPKNPDSILKAYYGNWHVFIKGKNAHGGCLFDTEKPYTFYIE